VTFGPSMSWRWLPGGGTKSRGDCSVTLVPANIPAQCQHGIPPQARAPSRPAADREHGGFLIMGFVKPVQRQMLPLEPR